MSEQRMTTDDPAFLKHEAAFWEDRYKTQHRTVHALEDKLSLSLAREQRLSARLDAVEKYARECARLRMEPSTRGLREALSSVPGGPL